MQRPQRVMAILGMHRSGTSCLTGSLMMSGLSLGNVYAPAEFNKRGNQESPEIVELHERMLAGAGGSWYNPVARCEWTEANLDEARRILSLYAEFPIWGFKDPRTLMTIEGWKLLIPDLQRVGIFRHPISVARSLAARNQFSLEQGLKVWYKYNTLFMREYKIDPFPVLCFDRSKEHFLDSVRKLVNELNLENSDSYDQFFSDDLRTHSESEVKKLPTKVLELYQSLQAIAY